MLKKKDISTLKMTGLWVPFIVMISMKNRLKDHDFFSLYDKNKYIYSEMLERNTEQLKQPGVSSRRNMRRYRYNVSLPKVILCRIRIDKTSSIILKITFR